MVSFSPWLLYSLGKSLRYPSDRGLSDLYGLDDVERVIYCYYRDSNSGLSAVKPMSGHYSDSSIPYPLIESIVMQSTSNRSGSA
jgi:hypothetical protein